MARTCNPVIRSHRLINPIELEEADITEFDGMVEHGDHPSINALNKALERAELLLAIVLSMCG